MPRIILKNYRPFEDTEPLRISLEQGFTALIGPNNSGKSSFLRFIHECRPIWGCLLNIADVENITNNPIPINFEAVEDPLEIFHTGNDRPLTIQLEFHANHPQSISRVELIASRPANGNPSILSLALHSNENTQPLSSGSTQTVTIKGESVQALREDRGRVVDVRPFLELLRQLHSALYVAAFRNAITQAQGTYYDLPVGTSFITAWHEMKTGGSREQNTRAGAVEDDICRVFRFDSLEINAANQNRDLQVRVNRKPYRLRELGGGLAQFIVTYANVAVRKPTFILLDEPELNLHPSLQLDFLTSLASYASEGIVFATHSIGLARASAERLYSFRHDGNRAIVRDLENTSTLAEFVGELSYSAYVALGFSAILLVEGVTDVKTVQQYLRKLRKDHEVVIIPIGGDQLGRADVDDELLELKRISNHVFALLDSERPNRDAPPASRRAAFVAVCDRVGIKCHLTERRSTENYFTDRAVKSVRTRLPCSRRI